ncbi:hypothetical protein PHAVU_004G068500 [Phaseolus vulgaris]
MDLFLGQAIEGRVQKMTETGEWVVANADAEITSSKNNLSVYGSMDASNLDNIVPDSLWSHQITIHQRLS